MQPGKRIRVLIVDDSILFREILSSNSVICQEFFKKSFDNIANLNLEKCITK